MTAPSPTDVNKLLSDVERATIALREAIAAYHRADRRNRFAQEDVDARQQIQRRISTFDV